jgi:hypothetical protein
MTKRLGWFAALALAFAGAVLAPGRTWAAQLDELDRFAGTWQSQGTFLETPYGKASSSSATTTCAWSIDHAFMICQQNVSMGGKQEDDLGIYTYDATANVYRFYNVRASATTSTTITVAGNTITYPFSFTDNGKNVTIRTVNIWENANLDRWSSEYSIDSGAT